MTTTLKSRILNLLPAVYSGKAVTVNQLIARLNSSRKHSPVARSTVRGRLSELVAAGLVDSGQRADGRSAFFLRPM